MLKILRNQHVCLHYLFGDLRWKSRGAMLYWFEYSMWADFFELQLRKKYEKKNWHKATERSHRFGLSSTFNCSKIFANAVNLFALIIFTFWVPSHLHKIQRNKYKSLSGIFRWDLKERVEICIYHLIDDHFPKKIKKSVSLIRVLNQNTLFFNWLWCLQTNSWSGFFIIIVRCSLYLNILYADDRLE